MKQGKIYIVAHRRRREGKTDYRQRLRLLKSGKMRLVVRKSLNNTMCQIIQYGPGGDSTIVSASSRELKKLGWKGHPGNIPASYLTGLLCGTRAKKKKMQEAILDPGLYTSTSGSRIYSALKGCLDAGLRIPHSEDILPKDDVVSGKRIADFASELKKSDHAKYKNTFSQYLKSKILPENLQKHFEEVRKKITKA